MSARSKKVARAKKPTKKLRPLQPDMQRRDKWQMEAVAEDGTLALEFHLAQATIMKPAPSIDEVVQIIQWAWTAFGQLFFEDLIREATKNPGLAARDRAVAVARRIWADVMVEAPAKKGGRPSADTSSRDRTIWVLFHSMLSGARQKNPRFTKAEVMRRMVRSGAWPDVKNARQMKEILMKVDRSPGKEDRERELKMVIEGRKKMRTKNPA